VVVIWVAEVSLAVSQQEEEGKVNKEEVVELIEVEEVVLM
jgi:hypothetical protein